MIKGKGYQTLTRCTEGNRFHRVCESSQTNLKKCSELDVILCAVSEARQKHHARIFRLGFRVCVKGSCSIPGIGGTSCEFQAYSV